jgi:phage terminase large subunit GpA-like protein
MVPGRQNDNVHDKRFLSGMRLLIKWPTISELSGKTIPRLWLFDYDRMADNIDKEGDPFDLTRKRAQTYRRFGMTVAESSPGREVENPKWMPTSPHEAPPTRGILALYNRGDRRRWYWRCPQCNDPFEGDFKLLRYPQTSADPMDAASRSSWNARVRFPIPPR